MTVTNIYANHFGLPVRAAYETWANKRGGAGNYALNVWDYVGFQMNACGGPEEDCWTSLYRGLLLFDTSALSGNFVKAAKIYLYGAAKQDTLEVTPTIACVFVNTTRTSDITDAVAGDYQLAGNAVYTSLQDYAGMVINGWNTFTLNATGLAALQAAINTGVTFKTATKEAHYDVGGPHPPHIGSQGASMFYYAYTDHRANFEVTYTNKKPTAFAGDIHIDQLKYRHTDRLEV